MNDSALSITTKAFPSALGRGDALSAKGASTGLSKGIQPDAQVARVPERVSAETEVVAQKAYGLEPTQSVMPGERIAPLEDQRLGKEAAPDEQENAEMERVVESINDYMQSSKRALEFSVDETSGRTVIKVMDAENDKVIRQIPPETALEIMKKLRDGDGAAATGLAEQA